MPDLIYSYANETDIPTDLKGFYEGRDSAFFLKVAGVVERRKLDEFRDNNVVLANENKKLKADLAKFDGIDPDKYHQLSDREREIMDEKLVKAGKIDEVVAERMKTANSEHDRQIKAKDSLIKELQESSERTSTQLAKVKIDNVLLSEAQKRGLQPGAETYLLAVARDVWRLDEGGNPKAFDDIGQGKVKYGKDGEPMKPGEWLDELQRMNKFLFKPAAGAGSSGGPTGTTQGADNQPNPWTKEHWNAGKQMEIFGKDKALAERLAAAAGHKIGWQVPSLPTVR